MKNSDSKRIWTTTVPLIEVTEISGVFNKLLWGAIIFLGTLIMFLNMYFAMFHNFTVLIAFLVVLELMVLLILGKQTNQGAKGWRFFRDARLEMKKVVWPTRQETFNLTLIILLAVIGAGVIIYFFDFLFIHMIQLVLK